MLLIPIKKKRNTGLEVNENYFKKNSQSSIIFGVYIINYIKRYQAIVLSSIEITLYIMYIFINQAALFEQLIRR